MLGWAGLSCTKLPAKWCQRLFSLMAVIQIFSSFLAHTESLSFSDGENVGSHEAGYTRWMLLAMGCIYKCDLPDSNEYMGDLLAQYSIPLKI